MWLVGDARLEPGALRVTLPAYRVSGGKFRGEGPADGERVGQVTLISGSCNRLTFR